MAETSKLAFTPCQGAVLIKRDKCDASKLFVITIDNNKITAIVTGMTLEMSGNYQVLHTLANLVYFYSFGDRVGALNLSGIGFPVPCAGNEAAQYSMFKMYDYYKTNRASVRKTPLDITLTTGGAAGGAESIALKGFLTGMRLDVADSQMGTIGYWSMRFEVLPQK